MKGKVMRRFGLILKWFARCDLLERRERESSFVNSVYCFKGSLICLCPLVFELKALHTGVCWEETQLLFDFFVSR